MNNLNSKTLFVVRALPYEAGGTPVVIRNLLNYLPKDSIYILGRRVNPGKKLSREYIKQKMFKIPVLYTIGYRFWKYFSIIPGFFMGIYIIKKYNIQKIVGVFQDDASLILAFLLAKCNKKIDFYPYFMDLYAEQKTGFSAQFSTYIQDKVFKRAKNILLINDGMRDFQLAHHSSDKFVTIPIVSQQQQFLSNNKKPNDKFVITFSGTVNEDRLETLQVFTKELANDSRFTFKFLTAQTEDDLRKLAVFFDGFSIKHCKTQDELFLELSQSDLLYLPLRFTYPKSMDAQMSTCFGAKIFDYLQMSVPILIHSPSNFFNYTYFENHNAGFLLNTLDVKQIHISLDSFFKGDFKDLAFEKYENANRLAKNFSGEVVSKLFLEQLNKK
ncbi:MAG: hypothetical protein V4663_08030 [Bacteroidota bacterium]